MSATRRLKLPNGGIFELPMPDGRQVDVSRPVDGSFAGANMRGGGGGAGLAGASIDDARVRFGGAPVAAIVVGALLGGILVVVLWPSNQA